MRMLPPLFSCRSGLPQPEDDRLVIRPARAPASWSFSGRRAPRRGRSHGLCGGISREHLLHATPKFLASTSGGVWANRSVSSGVVGLRLGAVVEGEMELRAVGTRALQGVRQPGREEPQVALVDILHARHGRRFSVVMRHPPRVISATRPSDAGAAHGSAGLQVHVDAGDRRDGDRTGRLPRPSTAWTRRGEMLNEDQKNACVQLSGLQAHHRPDWGRCSPRAGFCGPFITRSSRAGPR